MRIASVVLVMLASVAGLAATGSAQEAKKFAPRNQMFTLLIPAGESERQQTKVLVINRHKVPVEASTSILKDGTSFQGASVGIPAVVMRELPADRRFDILRDSIVKHMDGKVLEEKDIKKDPVPGKEYHIQTAKGLARLQIYTIAGWVIYAVVEGKTKDDVATKQAEAFYGSLEWSDKAKDVYRRVKR
jgi:hypothetical protein